MISAAFKIGLLDALGHFGVKTAEFHLFGAGTAASPHRPTPPDKISPDNGVRTLGTNFDLPRGGARHSINQAWNSTTTPKNQDFLNENNQGLIGAGP